MGSHIVNGRFQSDKYPTCPPGKVPLSVEDPMAQDLLWRYAMRRIEVDEEFSRDLYQALTTAGFKPDAQLVDFDDGGLPVGVPAVWVREGAKLQIIGMDSGLRISVEQDGPWSIAIKVTRAQPAPQIVGLKP